MKEKYFNSRERTKKEDISTTIKIKIMTEDAARCLINLLIRKTLGINTP